MLALMAAVATLLVSTLGGVATANRGNLQALTDSDVLTCMVPGPEGQSVPENIRRVSLQPGPSGTVWLPQESGLGTDK